MCSLNELVFFYFVGNFRFLEVMLMFKIFEIKNVQNVEGDSFYYFVCIGRKLILNKCRVIWIFWEVNVNFNFLNKVNKYLIEIFYKNDFCCKMLYIVLEFYYFSIFIFFQFVIGYENIFIEEECKEYYLLVIEDDDLLDEGDD